MPSTYFFATKADLEPGLAALQCERPLQCACCEPRGCLESTIVPGVPHYYGPEALALDNAGVEYARPSEENWTYACLIESQGNLRSKKGAKLLEEQAAMVMLSEVQRSDIRRYRNSKTGPEVGEW